MAQATTHTDLYPKSSVLSRLGNWIMSSVTTMMENNPRLVRVRRLQALSDDQLAARGIKREDIVRIVFQDVYHR